ncbi:RNA polymerase subunit sigma-70 [Streptomyces sp. NPDC018031]|uniref:RNA polymerase subunit sigma-70 n=1 Tax=Streptomyces sp. NPDC018031 TaxID=3365033 RepID=UPI003787419A
MSVTPTRESWLLSIWNSGLDGRERDMLTRRHAGEPLEPIGRSYGVSRERARQVMAVAEERVLSMADLLGGDWREEIAARRSTRGFVSEGSLANDLKGDPSGVMRSILLRGIGLHECRTWAGTVAGLWASNEAALEPYVRELIARAPFREEELRELAAAQDIPDSVPLESILTHPRSPLTRGPAGAWVRRRAKGRDAAYLWLADEGEPRRADTISVAIGGKGERVVAEALRRDDRFRLIRPEGTWALSEWSLPQAGSHSNALEAMLEVLGEHGPLNRSELFALTARSYPVSAARLQQCLISDRIGITSDGRIDLVERGAMPMEEKEPQRPSHLVTDDTGQIVGVRLRVDREILRGSGVIVHSWLTWYLGLRLAPMSRNFTMDDGSGVLTIRRNTSAAQLSSVRTQVMSAGMTQGCEMGVVLRLDHSTASIRHACDPAACPARQLD